MLVTPFAVSMSSSIDTGREGLAATSITLSDTSQQKTTESLLDPFHLIDSPEGQMTASAEDFSPFFPFLSHLMDDTVLEYFKKQRSGSQLIFWAQCVNCFYQALLKAISKQNPPHKPVLL